MNSEPEENPRRIGPTQPWVLERIVHRAQPHLTETGTPNIPQWAIIAIVILLMLGAGTLLYLWVGQALDAGGATPLPTSAKGVSPLTPTTSGTRAASTVTPTPAGTRPTATLAIVIPPTSTPAPLPTATTAPSGQTKYRVQPGDSLLSIAIKFGVTVSALKKANGLESDLIRIGEDLIIPSP